MVARFLYAAGKTRLNSSENGLKLETPACLETVFAISQLTLIAVFHINIERSRYCAVVGLSTHRCFLLRAPLQLQRVLQENGTFF
eukprot:COSAG06_NODE_11724_length_1472_cov_1.892935_1_plen_85_part_00